MQWIEDCISELTIHSAPGFHRVEGRIDAGSVDKNSSFSSSFLTFLSQVGFGSFFSGRLSIYKRSEYGKIPEDATKLKDLLESTSLEPFGYDGTTEGCYCFRSDGAVCWVFWHDGSHRVLEDDFETWITSEFVRLFSEENYKAYRKIKKPALVADAILDRKMVSIELLSAELDLVHMPGETAGLSRYNRLRVRCRVDSRCKLKWFTFWVYRTGSIYGEANKFHVSIPLEGGDHDLEVYVFDPFNVQFSNIIIDPTYEIDLTDKMRSVYKEIAEFL